MNKAHPAFIQSFIQLERKCIREDPIVGGYVANSIAHRFHNVTAYTWVLSGTFSLQWDMCHEGQHRISLLRYGAYRMDVLDSSELSLLIQGMMHSDDSCRRPLSDRLRHSLAESTVE